MLRRTQRVQSETSRFLIGAGGRLDRAICRDATLTDRTTQDITGQATYRTITGSHLIVVSNARAAIAVDSSGRHRTIAGAFLRR